MNKSIRIIIFLNLLFLTTLKSQVIPLANFQNMSSEIWNNKISPLLKMQLNVKKSISQSQQKTSLKSYQNLGIKTDNPDQQYVYLFFKDYPASDQISKIETKGGTIYRDSWIPPVGTHPYGYILANLPINNLNGIAGFEYVKKLDTAEKNLYPKNDSATVNIHAKDVWQAGYEGSAVLIGVLDSGLDSNFADFPSLTAGIDYSNYPTTDSDIENTVTGHGTHVTGSVLGRGTLSGGQYKGSAPDAGLVFIKIGNDVTGSASTAAINYAMRDAVDVYSVDIITMSYGGWSTWHDGTSTEDQAVDYAVSQGASVFISAGNEANDGTHYSGTVAANSSTGYIQVNVTDAGNGNTAVSFNCVWYDGLGTSNVLDVNYFNNMFNPLTSFEGYTQSESSRGTESEITAYQSYSLPGSRTFYVQVVNSSNSNQNFHLYYYSGYNQSGSGDVTFQNPDPYYTIGSPATADSAIAVGAHVSRKYWTNFEGTTYSYSSGETLDDITTFSSRGPRVDGIQKPALTAPGSAIISARDSIVIAMSGGGVIDNDGINDSNGPANYYVMQGTSMACPIAAGAAALLLSQDPTLKPWQVRNLLINNSDSDSYTGTLPNSTWGYGKLNIEKALEANLPGEIVSQTVNSTGIYNFFGSDISMNFSTSGSDGYVSVTEIYGTPVGGSNNVSGSLHHVSSIRYWQIESDKNAFNTSLTFSYDPESDAIQDENTLRIAHRDNESDPWTEYADITRSPGSNEITANNVSGFSQWIFASEDGDNALPVTLTYFGGRQVDNRILINWTTVSELENYGFNVYRAEKQDHLSSEEQNYSKINKQIINGAGNSSAPHDYTFVDKNVSYNKTYLYILEDVSFSGTTSQSEALEIALKQPLRFALHQNYPNPFNPQTRISYQIPKAQQVSLTIYDISGREVKTLLNTHQNAGKYELTFDASDLAGGIYIYKLKTGSFEQMRKMLLLK